MKNKKIDSFFKKRNAQSSTSPPNLEKAIETSTQIEPPSKILRIDVQAEDTISIERDPGKRPQIWSYNVERHDEFRRAYIRAESYQYEMHIYPLNEKGRRFQCSWFKLFPEWLEYSPSKDAIFCLPCYLFAKPSGRVGSRAFTVEGFRSWKKVNDGENCALLGHVGRDPNSPHKRAIMNCRALLNQAQHIQKVIEKQTSQQEANNRLLLKTSIDVVRWLTFQVCALRGHNERFDSQNPGNFIQLVKLLASYNEHVSSVVLNNATHNASYTSPGIHKEILQIFAKKIRDFIREEIGDAKFCIIVDESRDESKREQMAIVLRFIDKLGLVLILPHQL